MAGGSRATGHRFELPEDGDVDLDHQHRHDEYEAHRCGHRQVLLLHHSPIEVRSIRSPGEGWGGEWRVRVEAEAFDFCLVELSI